MQWAIRDIAAVGYGGNLVDYEDSPDELHKLLRSSEVKLVRILRRQLQFRRYSPGGAAPHKRVDELTATFGAERLVVGGARRAAGTTDEEYTLLSKDLDRGADIAEGFRLRLPPIPHHHPGDSGRTRSGPRGHEEVRFSGLADLLRHRV
jgi:inosose dehydratase